MTESVDRQTAVLRLRGADDILILCHKNPDGDTIGCAGALYLALKALGKNAAILCSDPIPKMYDYMNIATFDGSFTPAFVVAVDVASAELLGELEPKYGRMVDLCIDHHPSNTDYAALTCLDGEAAACAELVAAILTAVGLPLTGKIAECIYTGLVTDTGGFRFSNTTANSMRLAADIMESGVDTAAINTRIFESKSKARVLAEARLLSALQFYAENRIAVMPITLAVRAETGVTMEELEDMAGIPRRIEGVLVGVTIKEHENECRISLRTRDCVNASEIAAVFGGGGHRCAAGCTIRASVEEATRLLIAEIQKHLPEETV